MRLLSLLRRLTFAQNRKVRHESYTSFAGGKDGRRRSHKVCRLVLKTILIDYSIHMKDFCATMVAADRCITSLVT